VVWWSIYCGCLGASLGALPGLFLGGICTHCSQGTRARRKAAEQSGSGRPRSPQAAGRFVGVLTLSKEVLLAEPDLEEGRSRGRR
jgi:hypothetical protein